MGIILIIIKERRKLTRFIINFQRDSSTSAYILHKQSKYEYCYITLCCKDMFEPFENLTIVCKLAGVDTLLIIAAVLLFSSITSLAISILGLGL